MMGLVFINEIPPLYKYTCNEKKYVLCDRKLMKKNAGVNVAGINRLTEENKLFLQQLGFNVVHIAAKPSNL